MATPDTYRLLLVCEEERLVACVAHLPELYLHADPLLIGTRLDVLALSTTDQGRRLRDGRRLSDVVMQTLIHDALQTRPHATILTAIVAMENLRSLTLCERNGLRSQTRYDLDHVRMTGHFAKR
jgi:hypothetical protein